MCPTGVAFRHEADAGSKSNLRSAFDVLDVDGDGKISPDDLRAFYGVFPDNEISEEGMIDSMISAADSNNDGYVEYEEFEKVLNAKEGRKDGRIGLMEDAFRVIDKDGDGKVGHEDLKNYLNWAGFAADDDDVGAMIRLGGGDHSGGVTFEGFLRILSI